MMRSLFISNEFPSPMWGGVRGGGKPGLNRLGFPTSQALPPKGEGKEFE